MTMVHDANSCSRHVVDPGSGGARIGAANVSNGAKTPEVQRSRA